MKIEEVFSSRPRMKILKLINRLGALNVSEISRRIGLNYSTTNQHLKLLEHEGVIRESLYGRIRMYRMNESLKAEAVQKLIDAWEEDMEDTAKGD